MTKRDDFRILVDVSKLPCLAPIGPPLPAVVDMAVHGWQRWWCPLWSGPFRCPLLALRELRCRRRVITAL
jgi:hypothetical protein